MWWWFLLACQTQADTWTAAELQRLNADPEAREMALEKLDPTQQDLLLLQLAVQSPRQASQRCKEVRSQLAQEKCTQVIGRPHLQLTKPQKVDGAKP